MTRQPSKTKRQPTGPKQSAAKKPSAAKRPARTAALTSTSTPTSQPAAERRAAEAELSGLVAKFAPEREALTAAVRRSLRKRRPTGHEVVYEYRDAFVISFSPNEHGYAGVLGIRGSANGIQLYFNQAKGLSDPAKLLKGSAGLVRWILVEGRSTLTRPEVARLIDEAIARSPVPFAPTGRGPVTVRPTTARKAAKRRSG